MYLKKTKPINSSQRSKLFIYLNSAIFSCKIKSFLFFKKNFSGRNSKSGKIAFFSKSRGKRNFLFLNFIFFKRIKLSCLYFIFKLKKKNNKLYCLIKNNNNSFNIIPYVNGIFLSDYFYFFFKVFKNNLILGKKTFLLMCLTNFYISNINSKLNNFKPWLSVSNGTFCLKKSQILDFSIVILILPSKKKKIVNWLNTCFIGRNFNVFWKYSVLGNYKSSFFKGKKQSVRGVAMNPVDHPHGGRTKTNKPEVSPWGWIAKKNH